MDFSLTEEQNLVQESFRRAFGETVTLDSIRKIKESRTGFDQNLWQQVTVLGLPGLLVGAEYGGSGLTLLEAVLLAEEMGRSAAPIPFTASSVMGPIALQTGGSETQKNDWLPKIASGTARLAVAFSEPANGARQRTKVSADNGKLTGSARFVLDSHDPDAYLIACDKGQVYIVEKGVKGLRAEAFHSMDGTRASDHLILERVKGEKLSDLDEEGLETVINAGRLILAADSFGASEEMLRQAVAYSLERKQFDRTIGSFQAVKHMCAEMAAELQPCKALIWYGAYVFDHQKEEFNLSALLAKSHMDEVGRFIARTSTEVHGGMGFTDLMGLHFWYKRIGFNRSYLGNPDHLRNKAAKMQSF